MKNINNYQELLSSHENRVEPDHSKLHKESETFDDNLTECKRRKNEQPGREVYKEISL